MKVAMADRFKREARSTVEGGAVSPDQIIEAIQGAAQFQAKLAG